jgi:GTP-binding protein
MLLSSVSREGLEQVLRALSAIILESRQSETPVEVDNRFKY